MKERGNVFYFSVTRIYYTDSILCFILRIIFFPIDPILAAAYLLLLYLAL